MRQWLRAMRKENSMNQTQVAQRAGISQQLYSDVEVGTRDPSVRSAKAIAKVLDVDWTKFYEEDDGNDQDER
jgi:transcriptional regulator with XRE-family HTH domain